MIIWLTLTFHDEQAFFKPIAQRLSFDKNNVSWNIPWQITGIRSAQQVIVALLSHRNMADTKRTKRDTFVNTLQPKV